MLSFVEQNGFDYIVHLRQPTLEGGMRHSGETQHLVDTLTRVFGQQLPPKNVLVSFEDIKAKEGWVVSDFMTVYDMASRTRPHLKVPVYGLNHEVERMIQARCRGAFQVFSDRLTALKELEERSS